MTAAPLEEPLTESALLAHRLALKHCPVDAATGESCAWYHGFWQIMRVLGVAKTSGGHVDFLVAELRAVARSGDFPRLLISGSADYSMTAYASWAYRQEGAVLDLAVVDRCETPLALTRWYAARCGVRVTTHCSDMLVFDGAPQCDAVMTNSFLGYFDLPGRARLFGRWAGLLRPGGKLIITNRIRPGTGHAPVGFTREQAQAFAETVRTEARKRTLLALAFEPEEIVHMARAYAKRFRSVPLRSSAELVELLSANGFHVDRLDTAAAAGRVAGGPVAGPTLAEATDYVRVVATRR